MERRSSARFFDVLREGDVDGLRELLAADVQIVADGGGKVLNTLAFDILDGQIQTTRW
jgi:RNA polymerase sigma-70 factor (ECF subfamily)